MVKMCVSMWSVHRRFFNGNWTVMDFLDFCKQYGFHGVELLDVFWRNQAEELPQVRRYLADNGLVVGAYAVSNNFVQADPAKRQEAVQSVQAGIALAEQLGTGVVRVFAGDLHEQYDYDTAVKWIVTGLKDAARMAEEKGVVLALENHGKLAGRARQVSEILAQVDSPCVKSTFDMGNFLLVDESAIHAFDVLAPAIAHVHVKDLIRTEGQQGFMSLAGTRYLGAVCGQGEVPILELLGKLVQRHYLGAISLEFEGPGDECEAVIASMAHLAAF